MDSIGEQAKEVIDRAKDQGGTKGVRTLNKEIEELEDDLAAKEREYRQLKNKIDDKEDDLEETEEELEEIEEKLKNTRLTDDEREELEEERDRLRTEKAGIQSQINSLNR